MGLDCHLACADRLWACLECSNHLQELFALWSGSIPMCQRRGCPSAAMFEWVEEVLVLLINSVDRSGAAMRGAQSVEVGIH